MPYLDYAASAPLKPAVLAAMADALAATGNASSVHRFGQAQRGQVEAARQQLADYFGVKPAGVLFTAGATEANNTLLKGARYAACVTSGIEHPSVLQPVPHATRVRVNADGVVDLGHLETVLKALPQPALLALMLVNNETGVIQPVQEAARIAKRYNALVHCDAVQAVGKLTLNLAALGVDSLSLSAHKIGGPQGVGALILADCGGGNCLPLTPLLEGGGQEMRRRAGTENVAGIVGLGVAIRQCGEDVGQQPLWQGWQARLEEKLMQAGGVVVAATSPRIATLSCVVMPGVPAETQLMAFDLAGVGVSSGSACSSGKVKASHVLQAMGVEEKLARCALRISFGWKTTLEELEKAIKVWETLRQRMPN